MISKVSKITINDIAEYIHLDEMDVAETKQLSTFLTVAKDYIKNYTALEDLDEYADLVIVVYKFLRRHRRCQQGGCFGQGFELLGGTVEDRYCGVRQNRHTDPRLLRRSQDPLYRLHCRYPDRICRTSRKRLVPSHQQGLTAPLRQNCGS